MEQQSTRLNIVIELSEDVIHLFKVQGSIIDNEYYNLPFWFKHLRDNYYAIIKEEDLPEYVKELLPSQNI